jgi:hypothetical protein
MRPRRQPLPIHPCNKPPTPQRDSKGGGHKPPPFAFYLGISFFDREGSETCRAFSNFSRCFPAFHNGCAAIATPVARGHKCLVATVLINFLFGKFCKGVRPNVHLHSKLKLSFSVFQPSLLRVD